MGREYVYSIMLLNYIMSWKAKWIWIDREDPKNYYLYARKTFEASPKNIEKAEIKITADSKYVFFINGHFIGSGPIRGWPFEYYYDVYDVKPYLVEGRNVIAVIAQYYGISSFKYIKGRPGLLVQLEIKEKNGNVKIIGTDNDWKVVPSPSYKRNVPRFSCQQEWSEEYDARKELVGWTTQDYDDGDWQNAVVIGEVGIEPWKKLVERDIPLLMNVPVPPIKIVRVRSVKAPYIAWYIDLRNNLLPGKTDAHPKGFIGILTTVIESDREQVAKLKFVHPRWHCPQGLVKLNGKNVIPDNNVHILNLKKGRNLLLIDVTGRYHRWGTSLIIDTDGALRFSAPLGLKSPWATIGPFKERSDEGFVKAWHSRVENDLLKVREYIKPVSEVDYTTGDVFSLTVNQKDTGKEVRISNENALVSFSEDSMIIYPNGDDIELMLDFGKEVYGPISFEVDANEGVILDWNFFETLNEEHEPKYTFGLDNVMRYICREGFQRYRGIVSRGFRYATLTIRNLKKPLKIRKISCIFNTYPVLEKGSFECSDELLNQIWRMCSHTLKLSMLDTFVDCPTYEQTLWVGDARVEALVNYYAFGDTKLTRRCLLLIAKSLSRSPLVESQVPSGWQDILSTWSLLWVLTVDEYLSYVEDKDFLKEIYPYVAKMLSNLEKYITDKNLLSIKAWNMLDWAPMDTPNEGIVTHLNILAVEAFRRGAKLAEKLSDSENKERFLRNAERLKNAIISTLWDTERGGFIDSIHVDGKRSDVVSVAANALAITYDCVTPEQYNILKQKFLNWPQDWVKPGSPFGMFFVLEALEKLGYYDKILEEIRRNWSYMLYEGPRTCWEMFKETRSYCHGWSSGPLYFLSKIFLGFDVLEQNNEPIVIRPVITGLSKVKGEIPTVVGTVYIDWIKSEEDFKITVKVPFRKKIRIEIPLDTKKYKSVTIEKGECSYTMEDEWILECQGPIEVKAIFRKTASLV